MKTIRELRKEKGMTQEELGNRIGNSIFPAWKMENDALKALQR